MCFAIPLKVKLVKKKYAMLENGDTIILGHDVKTKAGDYLLVAGGIAVRNLPQAEGLKIRETIARLNEVI